jgi:chorismate mutase
MSIEPSLAELRSSIDALDDAIVSALSRRFALASSVARHKPAAVQDEAREAEVLAHVEDLARSLGGNSEAIRSVYRLILQISVEIQDACARASAHEPERALDAEYERGGADAIYEREFWSTFGEAGICVFWGLSADGLARLDAPVRRRLVSLTHDVASGEAGRRESLLGLISELSVDERVDALCRLASAERP